jgi:hypothetical protein
LKEFQIPTKITYISLEAILCVVALLDWLLH